MILLFANNAQSTLAAPITNASVSIQLQPGGGAEFPNPVEGQQYFIATMTDVATGLVNEIVYVTKRVGDILTVQRGQEGTTAIAWIAGSSFRMLPTAGTMATFSQVQQTQAGAPNFAQDTGSVNAYVAALNPPVTTRIRGLTVRIIAASSNTGASTLSLGAGSAPIINPDGTDLGTGAIVNGGVFEVFDDGVNYQLISANNQALSSSGAQTTGDFAWRPTAESKTGYIFAYGNTTIGSAASNATQLASATAANLFAWHWNNFSNTVCPVFTSAGAPTTRGLSAAADFSANKQIQVYEMRGRIPIGVDANGSVFLNGVPVVSGSTTTPGSVLGQALHTLLQAELPNINFSVNISSGQGGHFHTYAGGSQVGNATTGLQGGGFQAPITPGTLVINSATLPAMTGTAPSGGSGTPLNVTQLSAGGTWYIKL